MCKNAWAYDTLTLDIIKGKENISIYNYKTDAWADENELETPIHYVFSEVDSWPIRLWINGKKTGHVVIQLKYSPHEEGSSSETVDQVTAFVTETISKSPHNSIVKCWSGYYNDYLGWKKSTRKLLKNHGWQFIPAYTQQLKNGRLAEGRCTLNNYRKLRNAGITQWIIHGGNIPVWFNLDKKGKDQADAWWNKGEENQEEHMSTIMFEGHYSVLVHQDWYRNNWKHYLTVNNSIVLNDGCMSYRLNKYMGGRVGWGWKTSDDVVELSEEFKQTLFDCLTGKRYGGNKRTVGEVLNILAGTDDLGDIYPKTPMARWTTINPAPNHVFPKNNKHEKGTACILFDTSMSGRYLASNNVIVWWGNVTDRFWITDPRSLRYGIRCDYIGTNLRLKAIGTKCIADPSGRYMDGDRRTYGSDKYWP